jgi:hypothetical protein
MPKPAKTRGAVILVSAASGVAVGMKSLPNVRRTSRRPRTLSAIEPWLAGR